MILIKAIGLIRYYYKQQIRHYIFSLYLLETQIKCFYDYTNNG
jgi:hypothetical protein